MEQSSGQEFEQNTKNALSSSINTAQKTAKSMEKGASDMKKLFSVFGGSFGPFAKLLGIGLVVLLSICLIFTLLFPTSILFLTMGNFKSNEEKMGEIIEDAYNKAIYEQTEKPFVSGLTRQLNERFNCDGGTDNIYPVPDKTGQFIYAVPAKNGKQACYIKFEFTPTVDELKRNITAYVLAADSTLNMFGSNGVLGNIEPAGDDTSIEHIEENTIPQDLKTKFGIGSYQTFNDTIGIWQVVRKELGAQYGMTKEEISSGVPSEVDQWLGRPGYSDYNTGYAIDVEWKNVELENNGCAANMLFYNLASSSPSLIRDGTGSSECFNEDVIKKTQSIGVQYGFIVRYPYGKENITGYNGQYWHFRYVGKEAAQAIYNNGDWLTLEEYLNNDQFKGTSKYVSSSQMGPVKLNGWVEVDYTAGRNNGVNISEADAKDAGPLLCLNKYRYVDEKYRPDDLAAVGEKAVLVKEARDAFFQFQEAVRTETSVEIEASDYEFDIDGVMVEPNENGEMVYTDYGKQYLEDHKDEMNQDTPEDNSLAVMRLKDQINNILVSDSALSIEDPTQLWEVESGSYGPATVKEPVVKYNCGGTYVSTSSASFDPSGCSYTDYVTEYHDMTIPNAYKTNVKIHMYYDLSSYRNDEFGSAVNSLVGKGRCQYDEDGSDTCTREEAEKLLKGYNETYYNSSLGLYATADGKEEDVDLEQTDIGGSYPDNRDKIFKPLVDKGIFFHDIKDIPITGLDRFKWGSKSGSGAVEVTSDEIQWPISESDFTQLYTSFLDKSAIYNCYHLGYDFGAKRGTPVYAEVAGTFGTTQPSMVLAGSGNELNVVTWINGDNGLTVWNMHLSKICVNPGEHVEKGQKIGEVGTANRVDHLCMKITDGYGVGVAQRQNPAEFSSHYFTWSYFGLKEPGNLCNHPNQGACLAYEWAQTSK